MTKSEFQKRIDAMLDAEYEALGGDKFRDQFGDKMVRQMVIRGYTKRAQSERARDPEFNDAWIASIAGYDVESYIPLADFGVIRFAAHAPTAVMSRLFQTVGSYPRLTLGLKSWGDFSDIMQRGERDGAWG